MATSIYPYYAEHHFSYTKLQINSGAVYDDPRALVFMAIGKHRNLRLAVGREKFDLRGKPIDNFDWGGKPIKSLKNQINKLLF